MKFRIGLNKACQKSDLPNLPILHTNHSGKVERGKKLPIKKLLILINGDDYEVRNDAASDESEQVDDSNDYDTGA